MNTHANHDQHPRFASTRVSGRLGFDANARSIYHFRPGPGLPSPILRQILMRSVHTHASKKDQEV